MRGNRSPKGYRLFALLVAALIVPTLNSTPSAAQSDSQVRIVRLSFVEGTVTLYRPDVNEWAKAFVNTPIQQGFKLATDAKSFAEVEFENGSTARLGQTSELDFTNLSLSPAGSKINHLTLVQGYATFAVAPEKGDVYRIQAAGSTYTTTAKTMFRVDLDQEGQRLEVFKGEVQVRSPFGSGSVAKNQVLQLIPGSTTPFQITNGITEDAWDRWVNKRQQTVTLAGNKVAPYGANRSVGSALYGWNDLFYFGSWNSLPGFGSCWSPGMGAGWSPYSIGRWSWYPGFGYTWISGLPWGWLPFHYGSWIYPAGYGWCWLPGSFSSWSPGLVTWYQGPGWIGWAPRRYTGGSTPAVCSTGRDCSTAVSLNTFQRGRPLSPNDLVRVNPFHGRAVNSPTVPLTRNLRLPGPAVSGPSFISATQRAGGSSAGSAITRVRRMGAAPNRVFPRSAIRGAWDVQPHAPATFERRTRRFVNSFQGRPAVNNDMLRPARMGLRHPGRNPARLTSIPISALGARKGTRSHASSDLIPSYHPAGNRVGTRSLQEPRMPDFRQNNFPARNRSIRNSHNDSIRAREQTNRRSGMSRQRMQRVPASRPSSHRFGGGQRMGQPSRGMGGAMRGGGNRGGMGGGMRSSSPGGMGGGGAMRGGAAGPHGPHH